MPQNQAYKSVYNESVCAIVLLQGLLTGRLLGLEPGIIGVLTPTPDRGWFDSGNVGSRVLLNTERFE